MTFSFFRAATLVGASMLLAKSVHAQIDLTTISNPDKASCVMHVIVCCSWYISLCHDGWEETATGLFAGRAQAVECPARPFGEVACCFTNLKGCIGCPLNTKSTLLSTRCSVAHSPFLYPNPDALFFHHRYTLKLSKDKTDIDVRSSTPRRKLCVAVFYKRITSSLLGISIEGAPHLPPRALLHFFHCSYLMLNDVFYRPLQYIPLGKTESSQPLKVVFGISGNSNHHSLNMNILTDWFNVRNKDTVSRKQ